MVSTLLDVASHDRRHPGLRESAAIITEGLSCRVRASDALQPGLRLAGIVALAATVAIATMAFVVASQRPLDIGLVPMAAWIAVIGAALFGALATPTYRLVPPAAMTLVLIAGGSSVMGLRRSTLVPVAVFLLLSALSHPSRRRVRLIAPTIGIAVGALWGAFVTAEINEVFRGADSSWVYGAQWDIASDLVPVNAPRFLVILLAVAAAAGLTRRPRYAVAAGLLALPFVPNVVLGRPGLLHLTSNPNLVVLGTVAAALTVGASVALAWFGRQRSASGW